MGKATFTKANEFLEEDAKVVDVKAEDVKEEKKPTPPYVPPEELKEHYDFLKGQCETLLKRSQMIEGMYNDGIIPQPVVFKMLDEIHIADFVRNVSLHYDLTPEILVKILEFTTVKKQQDLLDEEMEEDDNETPAREGGYKDFEIH
jgi:hypothetical protein